VNFEGGEIFTIVKIHTKAGGRIIISLPQGRIQPPYIRHITEARERKKNGGSNKEPPKGFGGSAQRGMGQPQIRGTHQDSTAEKRAGGGRDSESFGELVNAPVGLQATNLVRAGVKGNEGARRMFIE